MPTSSHSETVLLDEPPPLDRLLTTVSGGALLGPTMCEAMHDDWLDDGVENTWLTCLTCAGVVHQEDDEDVTADEHEVLTGHDDWGYLCREHQAQHARRVRGNQDVEPEQVAP